MSDVFGQAASADMEGAFFEAVWNSADVGMCVTDANRRFVKVNDAYCHLYGYGRDELVGHDFTKVLPEEMRTHAAKIHDAFIAGAPESAGEWQVLRRDGVIVDVHVTATRVVQSEQVYKVTTVSDISSRKAAERKLQADNSALSSLEARYRAVIENFPNGQVIIFDQDLRYLVATGDEWAKLNIDPSALIGKRVNEIFGSELANKIEPYYRRALTGEQFDVDLAFAGETYNCRFGSLYDQAGNVAEGLVITQRVSERKRAEAEAKTFQSLMTSAIDSVVLVGLDFKIVYTNPAYDNLLGVPTGALLGKDADASLTESSKSIFQNAKHDFFANGQWQGELVHKHQNGDLIETFVSAFVIYDEEGKPIYFASIVRDIRDQRRAERQLELSEARLRMIVANLPVVVFTTDEKGIFTLSEGQGLAVLGLAPGQVVGASLFELYADFPEVVQNTQRALEGNPITYEVYIPAANQYFEQHTSPLYNDAGNISGVLGVSYNITDRKQAVAALERTNTRLAQLNELNSQLNAANNPRGAWQRGCVILMVHMTPVEFSLCVRGGYDANNPEWATLVASCLAR